MSKRCSAKNRNGKRCGAWNVRGATQCALHSQPGRAAELGSKHRRMQRATVLADGLELPYRPLKNAEQICEMMEETINRVRQGSLDPSTANTIGFLATTYLKVLLQAQTEQAEKAARENPPNVYQAIFDRLRNTQTDPKPLYASECEPAPLYPNLVEKEAECGPYSLPAPGEPIDDSHTPAIDSQAVNSPGIISVEVD
jgi:hypothetical protein